MNNQNKKTRLDSCLAEPRRAMESKRVKIPLVWQIIFIGLASVGFGLIFSSLLGRLYRYMHVPGYSPILHVSFFEQVDLGGFIFGYFLFLGLLVGTLIHGSKKILFIWLIGILYFVFASIVSGEWTYFGYSVVLSVAGFLLGRAILVIKKASEKK